MKTFVKIIVIAVLAVVLSSNANAQMHDHSKMSSSSATASTNGVITQTKTETIKVWGNCDMCKTRIEKATKTDGVSKANWDENTKQLTLEYNPIKVSSDDVQKKIAAVGYDTEKFKGDDKAYAKLDGCCQYDRKK